MRNLKKILALVLALIMSLSLMAAAGAKEFPDSDGITNDAYALAVNILSDLDVFTGFQDGEFKPTQNITRAEVAALIYRIATGDVGVDGYKTYAPYNQFKDIKVEDWYAGYVTYCANAGYIKGRNTGNFDAKDPVTGYEVLAMILRAVGYDKNGEFVGSNWQLNTASIATEKGVLENILKDGSVRLSEPASRQVVAEMLFRAIFIDMVDWNAATLSYTSNGKNLAKENLGTESITGVIMANKWANINEGGDTVLADGKTQMLPEGAEKNITLDIDTDLDAVGCTYTAYIQNETRVLGDLEYRDDLNSVSFNDGAGTTVAKLRGTLKLDEEKTIYFLNYDEDFTEWNTSDIIIRYAIRKADVDGNATWKAYYEDVAAEEIDGHTVETRDIPVNWDPQDDGVDTNNFVTCYVFRIAPEAIINDEDTAMMKEIFYTADRLGNNINPDSSTQTQNFVYGEVYVGTSSMTDVSDTLSWKEFEAKYFNPDGTYNYAGCKNGESLRIIDNDADGIADYIFKVEYWQDKAIATEKDELVYYVLDLGDYKYSTFEDEIAVGDVVNYTSIDGRVTVYKADKLTGKVTEKNFEKETILTTADDTNYGQSEIYNDTYMLDRIMNTEDETEYNFYLDEFGYIRTYELTQGTQYALLTEIYNTTNQAYNYVNSSIYTAEVVIGDADAHEYRIANANPFISAFAWTSRISNYYYSDSDLNFLQPAIAHLGVNGRNAVADETLYTGATLYKTYAYVNKDWNRGVFGMADKTKAANTYADYIKLLTGTTSLAPGYGVFNYGAVANKTWDHDNNTGTGEVAVAESFSFTNVAVYGLGDNDTISLRTASKLKYDKSGSQLYYWQDPETVKGTLDYPWGANATVAAKDRAIGCKQLTEAEWRSEYAKSNDLTDTAAKDKAAIDAAVKACLVEVYDVDYVQLQKNGIKAGMAHYYIDASYGANYNALTNGYVNATVETEFYIAMPNKVLYYTGYDKLPTINADHIRAAYAVATNTYQDSTGHDYWIANVIVIEVEELDDPYDSISLMYYNPNEISGSVRNVRSLNNMWRTYQPDSDNEANIPVVPKASNGGTASWGNQSWTGSNYGFYEIYDSAYADGTLTAGDVELIPALTTTNWAGYGIYAGTIQRIDGLTTSEYIDVDFLGRSINDAGAPFNDTYVRQVSVTTSSTAVPIYRIDGTNTVDLRLGRSVRSSDVKVGDEVILVYDKGQSSLAYIVDISSRFDTNGKTIYSAPTWLWNNYDAIVGSQDNRGSSKIVIDLGLAEGEKIQMKIGSNGTVWNYDSDTVSVELTGSAVSSGQVSLYVKGNPGTLAAVTTSLTGSRWAIRNTIATADGWWIVELYDTTKYTKSAIAPEADRADIGIVTAAYVAALIAEKDEFSYPEDTAKAEALLGELRRLYGYVKNSDGEYKVDVNATVWLDDASKTAVQNAINALNNALKNTGDNAKLDVKKDAALKAVDEMIGTWTSDDITAAKDALVDAINAIVVDESTTLDEALAALEAIYKDNKLVETNSLVAALQAAIDFAEAVDTANGAVNDAAEDALKNAETADDEEKVQATIDTIAPLLAAALDDAADEEEVEAISALYQTILEEALKPATNLSAETASGERTVPGAIETTDKEGNTVLTLVADVELAAVTDVDSSVKVLDLGGRTISGGSTAGTQLHSALVVSDNLTIDNGTIAYETDGTGNGQGAINLKSGNLVIGEYATITVNIPESTTGDQISNMFGYGVMITARDATGDCNVVVEGTIVAVHGITAAGTVAQSVNVTVAPTAKIFASGTGLYIAMGRYTIKDGATVKGDVCAIEVSGGTLIVEGGEIGYWNDSYGAYATLVSRPALGGSWTTDGAISVAPYNRLFTTSVEILGGEFNGSTWLGLAVPSGSSAFVGTATVKYDSTVINSARVSVKENNGCGIWTYDATLPGVVTWELVAASVGG